jgi:hypothetical protein
VRIAVGVISSEIAPDPTWGIMDRGTKYALIPAAVPVLALTVALPFVNRVQPLVFGFPLLLFWMTAWVAATPVFLWMAYLIQRRGDRTRFGARR